MGFALKVGNQRWTQSVPPAIAGGSQFSYAVFLLILNPIGFTHPLPQVVLTVSKYDYWLLRQSLAIGGSDSDAERFQLADPHHNRIIGWIDSSSDRRRDVSGWHLLCALEHVR